MPRQQRSSGLMVVLWPVAFGAVAINLSDGVAFQVVVCVAMIVLVAVLLPPVRRRRLDVPQAPEDDPDFMSRF